MSAPTSPKPAEKEEVATSNSTAAQSPSERAPAQSPPAAAKTEDSTPAPSEDGEVSSSSEPKNDSAPPLPAQPLPSDAPPLPAGPAPPSEDDGWDCQWDPNNRRWYFYNRFTGLTQWDNPRVPFASADVPAGLTGDVVPQPPANEKPAAGGYNPAIHGDYDPNAWYAQESVTEEIQQAQEAAALAAGLDPNAYADGSYEQTVAFNRFTGQFQAAGVGPGQHSDEAKSRRQMNAFFDVDSAANSHDGRSLKAERSYKKPSKSELKAFKEKRRAKKEEKRRAWLRD